MAYSNNLLFNNVFLSKITADEHELAAARHLVYESARDWYREAEFQTPELIVDKWLRPLLSQQTLELVPVESEEQAWFVVAPWNRTTPLGLCYVAPAGTDLNGYTEDGALPKGQHWMVRAVDAGRRLASGGIRWVILTNGVQWRLLDSIGLRRYEAYLEIDLGNLLQGEDDQLAAYLFYRLFRLEDAFERDEATHKNGLDAFLELSDSATKETEDYLKVAVTDDLGTPGGGDGIMAQFCMGIVNALDPTGTRSFTEKERAAIYRDATYLLYRLLFILYAEARDLLPMGRADYRRVSLTHLIDEAASYRQQAQKGGIKPTSLWEQLNTLFNSIHFSDEYLGIPPYNGGLFENEDKPYLRDHSIDNQFLAEALYQLAFLRDRDGKHPPERIDYRDLSVRHLGSLYEGMIEYQLFVAEEKLLARQEKKGKSSRVQYLSAATTNQKPNDEVIAPGKVYFAQSSRERKATGTHYTPEPLVEPLVQQTLGRLLSERWATFEAEAREWLDEIANAPTQEARGRQQDYFDSRLEQFVQEQVLSLRICDPAMGSGHFHVHIAHTLTNFILQVLAYTPWASPSINLDPNYWRRQIVEHCLYGVDINEMAVELAKLSLWLATMQIGRPLSFLDHHLKQGNSLLGVSLEEIIEILEDNDLNKQTRATKIAEERGQYTFRTIPHVVQTIEQANNKLSAIAKIIASTVEDVAEQEITYETVQLILEPYKRVGDLLTAKKMGLKVNAKDLRAVAKALEGGSLDTLTTEQKAIEEAARKLLSETKTIHWPLEFSHLFVTNDFSSQIIRGFDVVVGNPPYLGGAKISTEIGDEFLSYLKSTFIPSLQNTDLCAYFLRQGMGLLHSHGYLGMVTTNSIGEGDTRQGGLAEILRKGATIVFANKRIKWPGDATVEVNLVTISNSASHRESIVLDGEPVAYISSHLDDLTEIEPSKLRQNIKKAFIGSVMLGTGFLLDRDESNELVVKNPVNAERIHPFLIGWDINNHPEHLASREAIYFGDWELNQAANYPDLLQIVTSRVKPYRDKVKRRQYREYWWRYAEDCVGLRKYLPTLSRVLVRSVVSELHMLTFVSKDQVFSNATIVFAYDDFYPFSLLQSSIHEVWLRRQASSLRTDVRYTPTDCFQTFPFPQDPSQEAIQVAEDEGEQYYEHRRSVMLTRQEGLTKTYNRFHDAECADEDILELRQLHAAMDRVVLSCYGWEDIDLEYALYPNDRGKIRFMPTRVAQREMFNRLIELNQSIAAKEAEQGLISDETEDDETFDEEID